MSRSQFTPIINQRGITINRYSEMAAIIKVALLVTVIFVYSESYRMNDVQRDSEVYESDLTKPDQILLVSEAYDNQSFLENTLKKIYGKIQNVEEANEKLKKELRQTQFELQRKTNEMKRRKVANVQLENDSTHHDSENFWKWVCKITKHFFGGILGWFGIEMSC